MSSISSHGSETSSMEQFTPRHVHLVGSSPYDTNTEFFEAMSVALPGRLVCLPDGETGNRHFFVRWQMDVFASSPHILKGFEHIGDYKAYAPRVALSSQITLGAIGYDTHALESYAEFCALRDKGVVPHGVRFQVCLPTPLNVVGLCLLPEYQAEAEPLYEAALMAALRRIQDVIPKEDLAVQWDMAYEIGMLELPSAFNSWFDGQGNGDVKQGILERFARLAGAVDEGVKMGFHLCYGDAGHKHFSEPADMSVLVDMANELSSHAGRGVDWVHVPVPKNRTDEAYFRPLKDLKLKSETRVFLGLAHAWDTEGTRERIRVASEFLYDFGVSTECGFGRTEKDEVTSVLGVLAEVTEPELHLLLEETL
ncbi:hypothetical protein LSUB1_G005310 [Lachnellula subtilissima]|uniref:Uncharacterized protein n=1 Tax=Lachnellula subtilissima TaxID=602034 RepID=A0A8H8RJW1_9HELO|nr:hypothetical protein LSUB1_G005310 [Lachnellula subtilissima]